MKLVEFKGIYPKKKKETAGLDLVTMTPAQFYNVPLKVSGIPESVPCVKIGDEVKQGTLIAQPAGRVGINIFSPVSGKVLNIFSRLTSSGEMAKHILIMNNNKDEVENLPEIDSISDVVLIDRLRLAGVIDTISSMPAYLKYAYTGSRSYRTLLIFLDSTDPNNTVNQTLTEFKMEEVVNGARYFMNVTSASTITFVLTEANYKLGTKLKKHIEETKKNYDFKIKYIPNKYPFENPHILANLVCNKKINNKTSFLDSGISIESAEACYNFCRAVEFNKPVTTNVITLDGDNVERKGNYIIQNGVSFGSLLDFAGIVNKEAKSVLIDGGILAGKAQFNRDISISQLSNTIIFNKFDELTTRTENPCISCGKCQKVCPMMLNPARIDQAFLDEDIDELKQLDIHSCIDCGCCSYVCPAKRFLAQRIALAKFNDKKSGGAVNG
ncbi:MAG: 4Fe-4S dicluster domain-containing protein [Clostridia bacterium]|nr:4Fe-4S dicluster domain-containing protein [Clostridia bacterium]